MLNWIRGEDQNFSYAISLSINNLYPIPWKEKQIGDVDIKKKENIQNRI